MLCRSLAWLICMFVATVYSHTDYTKEWSVTESIQAAKQVAIEDLGALLNAGDGAVVTLVAGDSQLVAHRAVLAARSPMLADMLRHSATDVSGGQLVIPDMEGPVLRQVLAYLYTLQVPWLPGMAPQLLTAAQRFHLPALKEYCEWQLATHLSVETAADVPVLALKHSYNDIRHAAVKFIKYHVFEVLATKGWANVVAKHPKEAIEVSRLLAGRLSETSAAATTEAGTTATTEAGITATTEATTEVGTTDTMEAGTKATTEAWIAATTMLNIDPNQTPTTAAPPYAACPTSPLDEATISRLQSLSGEERGNRLHQAAKEGAVWELRALIAAGVDVEATDLDRWTALHWAADRGREEAASCLVSSGADVDARDRGQWTPLHEAACCGNAAVVRLLLAASADPNARGAWRMTPLHLAVLWGRADTAAALLEGGADRGAKNNRWKTPLDIARDNHKQQLIHILTDR